MIDSMYTVLSTVGLWISQFASNAAVGYGYLSDFIFSVLIVSILLSFIKRLI